MGVTGGARRAVKPPRPGRPDDGKSGHSSIAARRRKPVMGTQRENATQHMPDYSPRVGIYARVSTTDQTPQNQLGPLRTFAAASRMDRDRIRRPRRQRSQGAPSGAGRAPRCGPDAQDRRSGMREAGPPRQGSVHHLVTMARELEALGVDLVAVDQAVDSTTPAGRLLFHVLGAIRGVRARSDS